MDEGGRKMSEREPGERPEQLGSSSGLTRRETVHRGLAVGALASVPGFLAACGGSSGEPAGTTAAGPPRRGGTLKVGMLGAGSSETLNPNLVNTDVDVARSFQVYQGFAAASAKAALETTLAEEITPNKDATAWTIRLRKGIEFHNGKTLTADDAIYTLQYNLEPKNAALGAGLLAYVDGDAIKKIDDVTLEVGLKQPHGFFDHILSDHHIKIFPEGTTKFDKPIGTGPFKFVDWVQGQRATYTRNENYWESGKPHLDGVEILSIVDDQARINALQSGQVDLAHAVPLTGIPTLEGDPNLNLFETESLYFVCQCMLASGKASPPADDPRVRQALRLLVDREQVVKNAFLGHARIGNDMYQWQDDAYPKDLPQREYDPEQAVALLKAAGKTNFSIDLWTGSVAPGILQISELMAESAKKAGVTVNVKKVPANNFWSGPYRKRPLFSSFGWGRVHYIVLAPLIQMPNAPQNETNWDDDEYTKLLSDALATPDRAKGNELLSDSQRILYERGDRIIPAFPNLIDGASKKVAGLQPSFIFPLGGFNFKDASLQV
jgi:peptide/nickel transport system substrate-binding protein